jgi:WD40 repeat protein
VRVWDVASRQLVSTLKEHNARVVGLAVLAGDAHVVSASRDRSILTWDLIRERRTTQHLQRVGGINASGAFFFSRRSPYDRVRVVNFIPQGLSLPVDVPLRAPPLGFNARPRRLSTLTDDAFELRL